jgi:hypothetical protein
MKKARYFYGEETHNTWPKLFVLTDDGVFFLLFFELHEA